MPAEEKIITSAGIFHYVPWKEKILRHLFFYSPTDCMLRCPEKDMLTFT